MEWSRSNSAASVSEGICASRRRWMPCFSRERRSGGGVVKSVMRFRQALKFATRNSRRTPARVPVPECNGKVSLFGEFGFESFRLEVFDKAIDDGCEFAVHDVRELVNGQADTVIGNAVLRVVVGTDFLGAVAGLNLAAPLGGDGGLLLFEFQFVESRTQNAHGFGAVLDLRFFVLLRDDEAGGQVRNADGGVSCVDRLAAGTRGAERVDAEVLGLDFDVDFVGFRQNGDSGSGGVDAPLGFRGGDALHPMNSAFIFEL